jgi:hypothetical protein
VREDFSKGTIEQLAKRAGYVCSEPDCGIPTVGAAQGHGGVMNIGVAAHITAAARGGPRFDPALTSEQRRHQDNGIWLCQTHARLVDTDSVHFTVEKLHEWKRSAEARSFRALVTARPLQLGPPAPGGALPVDNSGGRLIDASRRDLAAFKRMPAWPRHPVALNLHMRDGAGRIFTTFGLAAALQAFGQIVIVAPPGTGKTTTLIQVSEEILALGHYVPVFVPLGEWSSQPEPLLQSVSHRPQYADRERDLIDMAREGRLVLILDGWNELDSTARKRANDHVKAFHRNFPDASIIVSTRRQVLDVPLSGPVVEIDTLGQDQQREIAWALRGVAGEALLDHAWRTPGIRELVAIPLYLTALLRNTEGGVLPTTKDEVLRFFVTEYERVPEHAEALRAALFGLHTEMLRALAVEATRAAAATLPESEARMVIGSTENSFLAEHQITQALQPTFVLDTLISHHILVRSGVAAGIAFQHQQFQEWYASFEAESLMFAAAGGNRNAQERLRTEILDAPAWEESILFACERLSRTGATGRRSVGACILQTMAIDPMLAAEMIFRSSEPVWEEIRGHILNLAHNWHRPNTVDRAVHFMIGTGRPDFAPYIWPLILSPDNQLSLGIFRAGRSLRPAVLGLDRESRIAALPEALRGQVLAEIVHSSGLDGIELAAHLAQLDASPAVQFYVLEALLFRRADRFVAAILRTAPDEVWQYLAERGYADELTDPLAAARVRQERTRLIESTTDLSRRLYLLVQDARGGAPDGEAVAALIERPDFPVKDQHGGATIYEAHRFFPEHVNRALLHRLCECQEIPFRTEELLQAAGVRIDGGPAVDRALHAASEERVVGAVAAVLGEHAIGRMMDALSALSSGTPPNQRDPAFGDRYHRLIHWISSTPPTEFVRALLARTATSDPVEIAQRADLLARHGSSGEARQLQIDGELRRQLIATIESWADSLLVSGTSRRAQLADVAQAAGRLAASELVPMLQRLLTEDLARWRQARAERSTSPTARQEASYSWTLQYRRAFAAIGNDQVVRLMLTYLADPDFDVDAASVLKGVWERQQEPAKDKRSLFGTDFSQVARRRTERQQGRGSAASSSFAEAIIPAIERIIGQNFTERDTRRAFEMGEIAFSLPYGARPRLIEALLVLPAPSHHRLSLLTVLVLAGEVIPFDLIADTIKSLLEEARAKPWLLGQNEDPLDRWLELLPFTDQPERTLEVIDLLEPHHRHPWHLRPLVAALGCAPMPQAEQILEALGRREPALFADHDWLKALIGRGTTSAAQLLLNLIAEGVVGDERGTNGRWLSRTLASEMQSHGEVRVTAYERCPVLARGPEKSLIEQAIAESADIPGVLLLVRTYGAEGKPFDGTLQTAVRHVALGERGSPGWSGATETFGVPVPELRKELFRMSEPGRVEAGVAEACLNAIDELRDEYGPAEAEPRHPDVNTGRPWPRLGN